MPVPATAHKAADAGPASAWPERYIPGGNREHRGQDEYLRALANALWQSRPSSGDFVLEANGEPIRVHRCVLAAASPVFKAMLETEMVESRTLTASIDAEPEDCEAMLRFVYSGRLEAEAGQLPGILLLAHRYEMLDLVPRCCDALVENLSASTAVEYVKVLRLLEGEPMALERPRSVPPLTALRPGVAGFLTSASDAPADASMVEPQSGARTPGPATPVPSSSRPEQAPEQAQGFFDEQPERFLTTAAIAARDVAAGSFATHRRERRSASATSPIAHAFVTIAERIAADPHLQMVLLRGL